MVSSVRNLAIKSPEDIYHPTIAGYGTYRLGPKLCRAGYNPINHLYLLN